MKLLIIDDEAARAGELKQSLEGANEVELASDLRSALAALEGHGPSVVLAAASAPGYKLARRIRKDPRFRNNVRMVMYGEEDARRTLEAHARLRARADRYMILPMSGRELAELISEVANSRERPAPDRGLFPADRVGVLLNLIGMAGAVAALVSGIAAACDLRRGGSPWRAWASNGGFGLLMLSLVLRTLRERRMQSERPNGGSPTKPASW